MPLSPNTMSRYRMCAKQALKNIEHIPNKKNVAVIFIEKYNIENNGT